MKLMMMVVVVRMQNEILVRIFKKDEGLFESGRPLFFWFDEFNWFTWSRWLHISLNAPLMIRAIILVYNRDVRVAASTRNRETGCGFLWMFFKGTPISHCHIKPLLYFTSISVFFPCCFLFSPFFPSLTACNLRNLRHFELHHFKFYFTNMLNYFYSLSYFNQTFW